MGSVRRVPRKFEFHWGKGIVKEEASVVTPFHEPTIQLLQYDSGGRALRFCVYHGHQFSRVPMIIDEETLAKLGAEVRKNPALCRLLKKLVP